MLKQPERLEMREDFSPLSFLVQKMIARLSGVGAAEHELQTWSAPNRYDALASFLCSKTPFPDVGLTLLRSKLGFRHFSIQECAAGQGEALAGLVAQLTRAGFLIDLTVCDLLDPTATLKSDVFVALQSKDTVRCHFEQRDAVEDPRLDKHFSVSILGYVHPYMCAESLELALINRALESDVVALIPGIQEHKNQLQSVGLLYQLQLGDWRVSYLQPKYCQVTRSFFR